MTEERMSLKKHNRRVHMANERTFLAWIRTSIGLMAFGFVVEKFALFIKQVSYYVQMSASKGGAQLPEQAMPAPPQGGYSSFFGIVLVGLGALLGVLAFVRYKKVERQIDEDTYQPSMMLDIMLGMSILAVGVFLIIYLVHSI